MWRKQGVFAGCKMILKDISILKPNPGPSPKPFTPLRFLDLALLSARLNHIRRLLPPRIVLQSARPPCACQPGFSLAGEELRTPTPVLSDTCSSPHSQSERAGNLGRREINVGLRQKGITTPHSPTCRCVSSLPDWKIQKRGKRDIWTERIWKLKETYPHLTRTGAMTKETE